MKHIFRKLKGRSGESLVESLVAILIFTFGSIIMLSMVSTAADINTTVEKADQAYYDDMKLVELAQTPWEGAYSITFSIDESGSQLEDTAVAVNVFGNQNGLYAYRILEGGG